LLGELLCESFLPHEGEIKNNDDFGGSKVSRPYPHGGEHSMAREFFQYWKPPQAAYPIDRGETLYHSASDQLRKVEAGDTVWIVTVSYLGELILAGRIRVGGVIDDAEAVRRFGENVWEANHHIFAEKGTEEKARLVNLMDIAASLRFKSKNGNDRLTITDGKLNAQQLQSMRELTEDSVRLLEELWSGISLPSPSELEQQVKDGAGFGDPKMNRKVERAAVAFVTDWYVKQGWQVQSVEAECCGFDLLCSKHGKEEHVEVKGVRGTVPSFIITRGEVQRAKNDTCFVLVVVTEALSKQPRSHHYTGAQFLTTFALQEIAFRASISAIKHADRMR
jgi:hypothetical protein